MSTLLSILVAEDDESDVMLLQRAFKEVELFNPMHVVPDGQEAVDFLSRQRSQGAEPLPGLILLDLKMPRRSGMQVLQWMRGQAIIRRIPVFIFSSSGNRIDIEMAYDFGANAYIIKPASLAERRELARFIKNWLHLIQAPLTSVEGFQAALAQRAALGG